MSSKSLKGNTNRIDRDKKRTSRKVGERKRATLFALPVVVKRWCGLALCSHRHRKGKETIHTSPPSVFKAVSLFSFFDAPSSFLRFVCSLLLLLSFHLSLWHIAHTHAGKGGERWRKEKRSAVFLSCVPFKEREREMSGWLNGMFSLWIRHGSCVLHSTLPSGRWKDELKHTLTHTWLELLIIIAHHHFQWSLIPWMSNSELCFRVTAAPDVFASSDMKKSRTLYSINVQETRDSS